MSQRVIWLVIGQSFLFNAFAMIVNAPKESKLPLMDVLLENLIYMIPIASLLVSLFVFLSIFVSMKVTSNLRNIYHKYTDRENMRELPPMESTGILRILGFSGPFLLPIIFIGMRTYLLITIV
jgi:hypothetical protein